ncbi:MAG: hypothetical protein QNJ55_26860 [Xenococcus sp. MO_188.B8]|nr:hypothetical protein [Xenococcus sp. MO_188.B8]
MMLILSGKAQLTLRRRRTTGILGSSTCLKTLIPKSDRSNSSNGYIELSDLEVMKMAQGLKELFGTSATQEDGVIQIKLNDFVDTNGTPYLNDPLTATPAQAATAWLAWLHHSTKEKTDENSQPIQDKTQAIVAQDNFTIKTYETRDGQSQIRNNFDFAIYTIDTSSFDPDNVV